MINIEPKDIEEFKKQHIGRIVNPKKIREAYYNDGTLSGKQNAEIRRKIRNGKNEGFVGRYKLISEPYAKYVVISTDKKGYIVAVRRSTYGLSDDRDDWYVYLFR